MPNILKINELKNNSIFLDDFSQLDNNNLIKFSACGIAVLYGPNGTGKTTLAKTFLKEVNTYYDVEFDGVRTTTENNDDLFYVIGDQNKRNIISGNPQEFFVGDNIRREYELKDKINTNFIKFCADVSELFKRNYLISAKTSKLFDLLENESFKISMIDIVNKSSRGKNIQLGDLLSVAENLCVNKPQLNDLQREKMAFLLNDYNSKQSILRSILLISSSIVTVNSNIRNIEKDDEAVRVLNKFSDVEQCIVCDNNHINVSELIEKKSLDKENIINSLTDEIKEIIEQITSVDMNNDPFNIKESMLSLIETADISLLSDLKEDISYIIKLFVECVEADVNDLLLGSELNSLSEEYSEIISSRIELSEEDYLYIEEIINNDISNNSDKQLKVERDENNNIKIYIGDVDFIGKNRDSLPLSAGEQNFISICFELLKARNTNFKIILLDDPISSFDSIYKNKIAYAIIKMLQDKNVLILTHNTDLLRLLEGQYNGCFKLYLFNNSQGANNGFVPLKNREVEVLLHLDRLLSLFRNDIFTKIEDVYLFLIAMIPFMRGYAQIVGALNFKEILTCLMHGYRTESVNIASVYSNLVSSGINNLITDYNITVSDILSVSLDDKDIVNVNEYPLLNKTLKHSLIYLQLRLMVEKTLTDIFEIDTDKNKQLGQIISKAFPNREDENQIRFRVKLTSKKTLLNEFNHFEGNLSIFQPAIDIKDEALKKEKNEIQEILEEIKAIYSGDN